jgi:hypothetical protein
VRKPTSKEKFVMKTAVDGLKGDIEALCNDEVSSDILGTMNANLSALSHVMNKLWNEKEKT